jgi:hypothetical protein
MAADENTLYEEAGRVHRFMLNWRYAGVLGYFAILYAVVQIAFDERGELVNRWILLAAAPIGLALLAADLRTRALYHAAIEAAKQFEPPVPKESIQGVYTRLQGAAKGYWHTCAIAAIFIGYSLWLLLAWWYGHPG